MNKGEDSLSFDIMGIQGCQRNRYPLLFIDQITSAIPGKSANGLKSFTYNEWFFPAHFPKAKEQQGNTKKMISMRMRYP